MSKNVLKKSKRLRQDAGIALVTTLLLMFLMSSLLVGFTILLISNQQLAGSNNDDVDAFYGAEAGIEQMTANLGNLFSQTYSPTMTQIKGLETTPGPPAISGVSYLNGDGSSGYTISLPSTTTYDSNGNPIPGTATVKSGPYAGLPAYLTEYTLTVNARTTAGREVKLQRTTQTVGIPAYSFGIFSDLDLSFFPGPNFNFGGRTHTNGNLYLAAGSTLSLSDRVDAYKDVMRTELINGYNTKTNYAGTVQVTTNPGSNTYRTLAYSEGSYDPAAGSCISNWPTVSTGAAPTGYNHNLINGLGAVCPKQSTGADQLNLGVAILGGGSTQPVDLIRRSLSGEGSNITGERYYAQASLRVLLSDNAADIMNLPCIDGSTQPFDLSQMANPVSTWSAGGPNNYAPLKTLYNNLVTNNVIPLPLGTSGATGGTAYSATDGYWLPNGYPIIKGYIKIEEQSGYSVPCGSWKDVTTEILGYGYVGRNINPVPQSFDNATMNAEWQYNATTMSMALGAAPGLPKPPTAALGFQNGSTAAVMPAAATAYTTTLVSTVAKPYACPDPHPYAVIRLERIRDNPSSVYYNNTTLGTKAPNLPYQSNVGEVCGVDPSVFPPTALAPTRSGFSTGGKVGTASTWVPQMYDFWPNVIFDTREGELRDVAMSTTNLPSLNGAMSYIEVDGANLTKWFGGTLGPYSTTGPKTKDPENASNNFLFYISDRRGNYEDPSVQSMSGLGWPPLSYTTHETGEYGWTDNVNSKDVTNGCPNSIFETGEDENSDNQFAGSMYYYGAGQSYIHSAGTALASLAPGQLGIFKSLTAANSALTTGACTASPSYANDGIWPMLVATSVNAPRENPPLFYRRAVKMVNSKTLTAVGACPGGNSCGISIATENPVYIQGDYNSNSGGNGFSDPFVASAISADAVTLLSDNWHDVNSFSTPYSTGNRAGVTSYYRLAILAGATTTFPQPGGATSSTVPQDFGTDGGVHNFLRYVEAWGGTLNYYGSIVELYHSRQANASFKCCNTVYSPPTRGYNFDTDFLNPLLLPPRTPLFRDVNTTGWTRLMLASQ